jgi:hypothetical protein
LTAFGRREAEEDVPCDLAQQQAGHFCAHHAAAAQDQKGAVQENPLGLVPLFVRDRRRIP